MASLSGGLFGAGLASAGGVGTRIGTAYVAVTADISGVSRGLAATKAQLSTLGGQLSYAGGIASRFGTAWTRNVTVPLVAAGGVAVKMAADFEFAMERTSALGGVPKQRLAEFRQEVMKLSSETAQAPEDLANALYFVSSAGLKAAQVLPVLEQTARGAATGIADAATIGDLLTGVLVAYAEKAPTAAQAMDVLVESIRQGKAEPEDFAKNIGTVIPVAAEMGVTFDEIAGSIAALTNININAARGATGLRYMLIQLMNPSESAKDNLDAVGLSLQQVQNVISERGLIDGLRLLADSFDLSTAKGKELFMETVGGVRAGHIALALIGEDAKNVNRILGETQEAMRNTGQEAKDAFKEMTATDAFKFRQAWNDLKIAAIEAGKFLLPIAKQIVEAVQSMAQAFTSLPGPVQSSIIKFGLLAAALGPVAKLFGLIMKLGGGVASAIAGAGAAAAGAAGRVAAVGATQTVAGMTMPVVGSNLPIAAGAAASSGAAGFASSLATVAGWTAAIAGAAAVVTWFANKIDDAQTSTDELAASTKLSVEQVAAIRDQYDHSAAGLNVFSQSQDKVNEAAKIYSEVLKEAKEAGIPLAVAQRRLNAEWIHAVHQIGGLTGSMPAFRQQLEATLGLATSPAAEEFGKWLGDRGGDLFGITEADTSLAEKLFPRDMKPIGVPLEPQINVDDVTAEFAPLFQKIFADDPQAVKAAGDQLVGLVTRINDALIDGAPVPQVMSELSAGWREAGVPAKIYLDLLGRLAIKQNALKPDFNWAKKGSGVLKSLTADLRAGNISWQQYTNTLATFAVKQPFQDLGQAGQYLQQAKKGSTELRNAIASNLRVMKDQGISLSAINQELIVAALRSGKLGSAQRYLQTALHGVATKGLKEAREGLSKVRLEQIRAAISAGNYAKALRLLDKPVKVKVDSSDTKKAKGDVDKMKSSLADMTEKDYKVRLDAQISRQAQQAVSGTGGIGKPLDKVLNIDVNDTKAKQAINDINETPMKKKTVDVSAPNAATVKGQLQAINSLSGDVYKTVYVRTVQQKHEGGPIVAHGGRFLTGTGREVDVRALVGEYVVNTRSTRRYRDAIEALNAGRPEEAMRSLAMKGLRGRHAVGRGTAITGGGTVIINLTVPGYSGDARELAEQVGRKLSKRATNVSGGFAYGR